MRNNGQDNEGARAKRQRFELQQPDTISATQKLDLPKVDRHTAIKALPSSSGDSPKRRFVVPRAQWNALPEWLWYVAVQRPGVCSDGEKSAVPLLWEYARERPWKGCIELPRLSKDPFFCDPDQPALVYYRPRKCKGKASGAVIVCPGGNYEFLSPQEGSPVASWLARQGIPSYVLRYRLLPAYGVQHALEDLRNAVKQVRQEQKGPVCIMGFSAGAHLCATFCSAGLGSKFRRGAGLKKGKGQLVQVLCYPCFDASEWIDPSTAGWWWGHSKEMEDRGRGEELGHFDLVNTRSVSDSLPISPTLLIHSTGDGVTPISAHSDRYVKRFRDANRRAQQAGGCLAGGVTLTYVKGAFGDHGCGIIPSWSGKCLQWLKQQGFHF